ncbi:MAG: hypothetical protein R3E12_16365 [Candidatus Eisenbacteria bacterium]|uniref:Alginate export domain-containing protein n=1 Tax=Eiseniibacteriota bacterium TaxID=2212470 RepID=A0A956RNH7_UNCEI|nr:hypothetical protein [Candidatus Eisenbacteria bacterium]
MNRAGGCVALLGALLAMGAPTSVRAELELGGFVEGALGVRTAYVPRATLYEPWIPLDQEFTLRETRLQLRGDAYGEGAAAHFRVDVLQDDVADGDGTEVDLREGYAKVDLGTHVELRAGRQPTTWGTGDLLFINDLFPKDYVSFFVGREDQYLKLPSDAIRLGIFSSIGSADLVYTPVFEPDRVSDPDRLTQPSSVVRVVRPEHDLENGEFALRLHRLVRSYEVAAYGYRGFWKSPRIVAEIGDDEHPAQIAGHTRLVAVGASVRGPFLGGLGWAEGGYYDSESTVRVDLGSFTGSRVFRFVPPTEVRLLFGHEHSLPNEWTLGGQAYRELRELVEDRVVFTLRLTKLMRYQTIRLSLFAFYGQEHAEEDGYVRLTGSYAVSDAVDAVLGVNFFAGDDHNDTLFGAFDPNDNIYARLRFSF